MTAKFHPKGAHNATRKWKSSIRGMRVTNRIVCKPRRERRERSGKGRAKKRGGQLKLLETWHTLKLRKNREEGDCEAHGRKHERALQGGTPEGKALYVEKTSYIGDYGPRNGMARGNRKEGADEFRRGRARTRRRISGPAGGQREGERTCGS